MTAGKLRGVTQAAVTQQSSPPQQIQSSLGFLDSCPSLSTACCLGEWTVLLVLQAHQALPLTSQAVAPPWTVGGWPDRGQQQSELTTALPLAYHPHAQHGHGGPRKGHEEGCASPFCRPREEQGLLLQVQPRPSLGCPLGRSHPSRLGKEGGASTVPPPSPALKPGASSPFQPGQR